MKKSFGSQLLINELTFQVPKGAIIGVVGSNGIGKSTLFSMLVGHEQPDFGVIKFGDTVKLAYVDQSRDYLSHNKTVWEEISDGLDIITVGQFEMASRVYVGRFNFKGSDQQKMVKDLSGGERNRVHLAKLLKSGGNMLLLDEPTNDLDIEALRALEEGLSSFPGSAMIISHDRWFLDRLATHILSFEGDSTVKWFEGNYTEYEEARRVKLGEYALQSHSGKYRKLQAIKS